MPTSARRLAVPFAVALALAVAACGSGGGDEEQVKDRVNGFYDALADKKADEACDSLSEGARNSLTKSGQAFGGKGKERNCEDMMGILFTLAGKNIDQLGDTKVGKVKVDGDKATVAVEQGKTKGTIPLVKEDGDWLLSDLSAGQRR